MNIDIQNVFTDRQVSLAEINEEKKILLVFLRHFGCIFCREALNDLSALKDEIASKNIELIFVHMSENKVAENYFEEYNLKGVQHISDPSCKLYQRFGLTKGTFSQLFGLQTWIRGYEASQKGINYSLKSVGDSLQMPGIFILYKNQILNSYIHKTAADKPDYSEMLNCC